MRTERKHVNFMDKEIVYEPALYSWLERVRDKNLNIKSELASKKKKKKEKKGYT